MPYVAVLFFCLGTALAIGYMIRGNRVAGDAAIGIFLVASLAFGFLARHIYCTSAASILARSSSCCSA
jgi:ABC-type Mn2+/Zn2+ transport system permease subunit